MGNTGGDSGGVKHLMIQQIKITGEYSNRCCVEHKHAAIYT